MFCPKCGSRIEESNTKFCPHCGAQLPLGSRDGNNSAPGGSACPRKRGGQKWLAAAAALCVVAVAAGIGIFWWMNAESDGFDEEEAMAAVENYQEVNDSMTALISSEEYAALETPEKAEMVLAVLENLVEEEKVEADSIGYDAANAMIYFTYADGAYGGVMLEDFAEGVSGVGEASYDTAYNGEPDDEILDNWPSVPDFGLDTSPYMQENLSAVIVCDLGYESFLQQAQSEANAWNEAYLDATLVDSGTVSFFRDGLLGYDLVIIQEHGNIYNGNPIIFLQETTNWVDALAKEVGLAFADEGKAIVEDLKENRIALVLSDLYWHYVLLPEFFSYYYGDEKLEDAIVWLGCCKGYYNASLVSAFANCGAKAVLAATDSIWTRYDFLMQDAFTYMLLCGCNVEDSLEFAKSQWGYNDAAFLAIYWNASDEDPAEIRYFNGGEETLVTLTSDASALMEKLMLAESEYTESERDSENYVWRMTAMLEQTSPISTSDGNYITLFEYDSYGNLTSFAHGCDWYSVSYAYDEEGNLRSQYTDPDAFDWVEGDPEDLYARDIDYYIENGVRYQSPIQDDMHILLANIEYTFYTDENAQSLTLECDVDSEFYKSIVYYYDSEHTIIGVDVTEDTGDFIVTEENTLSYNADKSRVTVTKITENSQGSWLNIITYTIVYDENGNAVSATGTDLYGKTVTYTFRWEKYLRDLDYEDPDTVEDPEAADILWKEAYIDYIEELEASDSHEYALIYVDDDDIPELFVEGNFEYEGDSICAVTADGEISEYKTIRRSASYIERSGMISDHGGNMDYYPLCFIRLEDGVFTQLEDAYGLVILEYDEDGGYSVYYWEDEEVSEEEFYNNWDSIMCLEDLQSPYEDTCSASEILAKIQSLA